MSQRKRWNPRNLLILLAVIILTLVVINIFSVLNPTEASDIKTYKSVIVQNGDNLWNLAVTYMPNRDPREVIDNIKQVNKLSSETIAPGEVLEVPINN